MRATMTGFFGRIKKELGTCGIAGESGWRRESDDDGNCCMSRRLTMCNGRVRGNGGGRKEGRGTLLDIDSLCNTDTRCFITALYARSSFWRC